MKIHHYLKYCSKEQLGVGPVQQILTELMICENVEIVELNFPSMFPSLSFLLNLSLLRYIAASAPFRRLSTLFMEYLGERAVRFIQFSMRALIKMHIFFRASRLQISYKAVTNTIWSLCFLRYAMSANVGLYDMLQEYILENETLR